LGSALDRLEAFPTGRPEHGGPVLAHGVPLGPVLTPSPRPCPSQGPPVFTFSLHKLFHLLGLSLPSPWGFPSPRQLSPGHTQPPFLRTSFSQSQWALRCVFRLLLVRPLCQERVETVFHKLLPQLFVVNELRTPSCTMAKLGCANSRCIVLVAFSEDAKVVDKWLETQHHPLHPGHPCLEEPDQLVDVVPRDLLRLVQQENCIGIACHKRLQWSPILTRTNWKVGVGVRP